jgi:hypothetical protein
MTAQGTSLRVDSCEAVVAAHVTPDRNVEPAIALASGAVLSQLPVRSWRLGALLSPDVEPSLRQARASAAGSRAERFIVDVRFCM